MGYRYSSVMIGIAVLATACGDDEGMAPSNTADASASSETRRTESATSMTATDSGAAMESSSLTSIETNESGNGDPSGADGGTFVITSPAFADGEPLPYEHTCEGKAFGDGFSPELNWSGAPARTKSYALVFKDLTLLSEPRFAYHWAAWNIPATVTGLAERLGTGQFPEGLGGGEQFRAGPPHENEFFGPCPAWRHLCFGEERANDAYAFTLYAFDVENITPPEPQADVNYVSLLSEYFDQVAIAVTEVNATSDASPSSAPMCPPDAGTDADNSDSGTADSGTADSVAIPVGDAGETWSTDASISAIDASVDGG